MATKRDGDAMNTTGARKLTHDEVAGLSETLNPAHKGKLPVDNTQTRGKGQ